MKNKKNKKVLKGILFELSTPEEKQQHIFNETKEIWKTIELMERSIAALSNTAVNHSSKHTSLMSMVQESIEGLRFDMSSSMQENKKNLEEHFSSLLGKYSEYEKSQDGKSEVLTKSLKGEITSQIKFLKKEIDRISSQRPKAWGGSSRMIYNNGQPMSPQNLYSDINLIMGPGLSLSAVNSNSNLWVDVTISVTGGGGGGGINFETPSGAIDSSNVTYTVVHTPAAIVLNGLWYFQDDGYTLSGLTVTMLVIPQTGSTLRSAY